MYDLQPIAQSTVPKFQPNRRLVSLAVLLLILSATIVLIAWFWLASIGWMQSYVPRRVDACVMAQDFVTSALKAPSTATFPNMTEANCRATERDHVWNVHSYVDAQNGFGAMLRSPYTVKMIYSPTGRAWTLLHIQIDTP